MNNIDIIKEFIESVDFDCSCPHECKRDYDCEKCGFHTIPKSKLLTLAEEYEDKSH